MVRDVRNDVQIRGARVEIQIQCLAANGYWRKKERSVLFWVGSHGSCAVGCRRGVCSVGLERFETSILLGRSDESAREAREAVLHIHFSQGIGAIEATRVSLIQATGDFERPF